MTYANHICDPAFNYEVMRMDIRASTFTQSETEVTPEEDRATRVTPVCVTEGLLSFWMR